MQIFLPPRLDFLDLNARMWRRKDGQNEENAAATAKYAIKRRQVTHDGSTRKCEAWRRQLKFRPVVCRPFNSPEAAITFPLQYQRWCRLWIKGRPFPSHHFNSILQVRKGLAVCSKPCRALGRRAFLNHHIRSPVSARQTNFFRTKWRRSIGMASGEEVGEGVVSSHEENIGRWMRYVLSVRTELEGRKSGT